MSKSIIKRGLIAAVAAAPLLFGGMEASAQQVPAAFSTFRNLLVGGDFGTNPYQRGQTAVTGITTTGTYHADHWFAFTSGSSAFLTRIASGLNPGEAAAEQLARTASNANTTAICMVQILENNLSVAVQGKQMVLSYEAKAAANFSGTGVQAVIVTGTGASEAMSNLIAGTWTGQANVSGIALQAINTTELGYSASFTLPAAATEVAVELCFNGVGAAGAADGVIFNHVQLEVAQGTGNAAVAPQPTPFEYRTPAVELALAQRYAFVLTESALIAPVSGITGCKAESVTVLECALNFPVQMVKAPAMTYAAGFATETTVAGGTLGACTTVRTATTLTAVASATGILIECVAGTVPAAGSAGVLMNNSGTGKITASAEL